MQKSTLAVLALVGVVFVGLIFYTTFSDETEEPTDENGETVPDPGTGFYEESIDYELAEERLYSVGDSPSFVAGEGEDFVVVDGEEHDSFDTVAPPILDINGQPGYTAMDGEQSVFMVGGEEKVRHDLEKMVSNPQEIDGEIAYILSEAEDFEKMFDFSSLNSFEEMAEAYEDVISFSVYWGDEVIGENYQLAEDLVDIGGEPAYKAVGEDGDMRVFHGDYVGEGFDYVGRPTEVGGELAYYAWDSNSAYVVVDGEKVAEYNMVDQLNDFEGEPGFVARDGEGIKVVVDGEEVEVYGVEYDGVSGLQSFGGAPFFIVERADRRIPVFDGVEKDAFHEVKDVVDVGGQPAYRARRGDEWFLVHGTDVVESINEEDGMVGSPRNIGGRLSYKVIDGVNQLIVLDGDELVESDYVSDPIEFSGEIGYIEGDDSSQRFVFNGYETNDFEEFVSVTDINGRPKLIGVRNGGMFLVGFEGGN